METENVNATEDNNDNVQTEEQNTNAIDTFATPKQTSTPRSSEVNKSKRKAADESFSMNTIRLDKTPTLPKVAAEPKEYTPMPYVFRVPVQNVTTHDPDYTISARCPPFYIQIDHLIAVVWSLYSASEQKKPLGINQLQWAMELLSHIRNDKGAHPRDVVHCMDTIGDALLDLYSDLLDIDDKEKNDTVENVEDSGDATNVTAIEKEGTPEKWRDNSRKSHHVPFSISYADMSSRAQTTAEKPPAEEAKPEQLLKECEEERNNLANYLNQWRKEQMQKIMVELDRLHSIENAMGKTGKEFERYMDESDKRNYEMLIDSMKQGQK